MADITMPQLGETVTEGTITRWAKQVGDRIEEDEVLFEVSTDKVDSEVPSPVSGVVTEIVVAEGETVPVGAKLAVVGDGDGAAAAEPAAAADSAETSSAAPAAAGGSAPAAMTPPDPAEADPPPPPADAAGAGGEAAPAIVAEAAPAAAQEEAAAAPPAAAPPAAPAAPATPAAPAAGDTGGAGASASKVLSPVVRKLIAENNLDPANIAGTGAGGRITRADVLAALDAGAGAAKAAPSPAAQPKPEAPAAAATAAPSAAAAPAAPAAVATAGGRDTVIPFSNIRRRTAEHMVRSLATSAHTLVVIEVDYDNVEKVRTKEKARFKETEGVSLSYLPFIARAVVDAVREFPHVNASVGSDELIVHGDVNLGVAVDLNFEGLIVPVVQDAGGKRLRALAREIAELANRARTKKLGADDIAGGTFTITNAGGYGTLITGPIINQPQVAILSTDGVKPQPVALPLDGGGYGMAVHMVGNLAISFDHRAFDGAYAAAFLAKIREILETRDWATELA